ncbi:hypothetical protein H5410_044533 [Solanum commersonii]|uniref:Uncharacterized protein n=1 Tax=Solanum commersonii TaxID=4109 RepID=A0A9J5X797_SOLCO|nr:hypothetical protein H5410_044533 [Solanum commersonii]
MDFPVNEPMFHDPTLKLWEPVTHLPLLSLFLGLNRRHDSIPPSGTKSTRKILNLISGWSPATNNSPKITLLSPELVARRSSCLLFMSSLERRRTEREARRSPVGAGPREVSGRRSLRLPDRKRRPVAGWFSQLLADRRWLVFRLSS